MAIPTLSVLSCDSDITVWWLCSEGEVGRSERQTVLWLWLCRPRCQLPFRPQRCRHTHWQKGQPARCPTVMETRKDSYAFSTHFFLLCSRSRRCTASRSFVLENVNSLRKSKQIWYQAADYTCKTSIWNINPFVKRHPSVVRLAAFMLCFTSG